MSKNLIGIESLEPVDSVRKKYPTEYSNTSNIYIFNIFQWSPSHYL